MKKLQNYKRKWVDVPQPFIHEDERRWAVCFTLLVYLPFIIFFALFIYLWVGGHFFVGQLFLLAVLLQIAFVCHAKLEYGIFPEFEHFARRATALVVFLIDRLHKSITRASILAFGASYGLMITGVTIFIVLALFVSMFLVLRLVP